MSSRPQVGNLFQYATFGWEEILAVEECEEPHLSKMGYHWVTATFGQGTYRFLWSHQSGHIRQMIAERVMRIWNVDTRGMCRQHLLGEHNEMHMLVGAIKRGTSLSGFLRLRLIDTRLIKSRHDQLRDEMTRRGYLHNSPLFYQDKLKAGYVNPDHNLFDLKSRCARCRARFDLMELHR